MIRRMPPPGGRPPLRVRPLVWLPALAAVGLFVWFLAQGRMERMDADDWAGVARLVLILVLVSAGVMSGRFRLKEVVRYALIWAVIVGVLVLLYLARDDIQGAILWATSGFQPPANALPTGPGEIV